MDCEQLIQTALNGRDFVDYLSASLTPMIALLAGLIAYLQWRTNANRLKSELFDRRYEQFVIIRDFLGHIRGSGKCDRDVWEECHSATRGMRFILNKKVAEHIDRSILDPASELDTLGAEEKGLPMGDARSLNIQRQREIKNELERELVALEERFSGLLQLQH